MSPDPEPFFRWCPIPTGECERCRHPAVFPVLVDGQQVVLCGTHARHARRYQVALWGAGGGAAAGPHGEALWTGRWDQPVMTLEDDEITHDVR